MKTQAIIFGILLTTILLNNLVLAQETCEEEWTCSDWSSCKDGLRTRVCTDESDCGTETYKPFESEPCMEGEEAVVNTGINGSTDTMVFSILVVVLVVGITGILLYRKRKK